MTMEIGPSPPVVMHPPVSWGAIFAGAAVGVATSLLLSALGAGLGFSLGFPGLATHESLAGFTPQVGAYAMVAQVLSGALGGYVTGRMRHVWLDVHYDEAHFRDTAHGLIAWAVMTIAAVFLAAAVLAPYAAALAGPVVVDAPPVDPKRAADIAAQSSFFIAVGMLLSAFVASVAARIGGQQAEAMHLKHRGG